MKSALLWLWAGALAAQTGFTLRESEPGSLEIRENGRPVLVYRAAPQWKPGVPERYRRGCYVHPLWTPGGVILTDDFPADHYHHRGMAWMWPEVFWRGQQYDMWVPGELQNRFVRWLERSAGRQRARLRVENGWFLGSEQALRETVAIDVSPAVGPSRTLAVELRFTPLREPVTVRGVTPDKKGYGGFVLRFAPRTATWVRGPGEHDAPDSNLRPLPWAELEGVFAGKRAGARITIDPANPGYPNGWCLRHYGFLGVNFPGLTGYAMEPGKPLTLRYRVTVFDGE